jgi:hypothetical protein
MHGTALERALMRGHGSMAIVSALPPVTHLAPREPDARDRNGTADRAPEYRFRFDWNAH